MSTHAGDMTTTPEPAEVCGDYVMGDRVLVRIGGDKRSKPVEGVILNVTSHDALVSVENGQVKALLSWLTPMEQSGSPEVER